MDIVIAGDGEVGFYLAKLLSSEKHNITIVDPHTDLLKLVDANTDLMTITGDSTSTSVLERANIKKADLLISVVHNEQINIVTCILGKKLGAKRTIARINNSEYLTDKNKEVFKSMGIDSLVFPERIAAKEIVNLLKQSAVTEIFEFTEERLSLFLIRLDEKSQVINKSLNQIVTEHPNLQFRAVAIHRNSETIIPKGDDVFLLNDLAYVITKPDGVEQLLKLGGKKKVEIKNLMIVGGGRIGRKTTERLQKDLHIKLIEIDKDKCFSLADNLKDTLIINGDARNIELLEEEGIREMDAFVSVTNDSETNIFSCLLAKKFGVKKIIPLIETIEYIDIAQNIGVETFINKKLITASYIVRFTMQAEVSSIKCLHGIDAEVMEFVAQSNSPATKKKIKQLKMPKGAIIGGVIRGNHTFIAVGDSQIQVNDKVVVFSLPEAIHKVEYLFQNKRILL